jgi:hypothetical protein
MDLIKKSFSTSDIKKKKSAEKINTKKINKERQKKLILKYEYMINIETKVLNEFEKIKQLHATLIEKYRLQIPALDKILSREILPLHASVNGFQLELWLLAHYPEDRIKSFMASIEQLKSKKLVESDLTDKENAIVLIYPDVESGIYRRISLFGDIDYRKELDECMGFYEKIEKIFASL